MDKSIHWTALFDDIIDDGFNILNSAKVASTIAMSLAMKLQTHLR